MSKVISIKGYVTAPEAAEMMEVSPDYVYRLKSIGRLEAHYLGTTLMFRERDVIKYIETHPFLGSRRKQQEPEDENEAVAVGA